MVRTVHLLVAAALLTLVAACGSEATTPVDLNATTSTTVEADDPNAEAREQVLELAKDECRKDPTREFGVIVFADPDTGEEVSRFEFPCADLDE